MHADRRFEPFPLTSAQRGIWFAQLLSSDVPITIAQYVVVDGSLDATVLEKACVTAAHEFGSGMLKLLEVDGEPFQQIDPELSQSVEVVDLRGELEPETAAHEWMRNEYTRPFRLGAVYRFGNSDVRNPNSGSFVRGPVAGVHRTHRCQVSRGGAANPA